MNRELSQASCYLKRNACAWLEYEERQSFLTEELKVYAIDTIFYLLPNVDRLLCQTRISVIHTQRD